MLFLSTWLGQCCKDYGKPVDLFCCNRCFKKRKKLEKLYNATVERVEEETNIVKLIKDLRNTRILMNNSLMNDDLRFMISHNIKNYIDLDDCKHEHN
jgi:hypothetical protein